MKIAKSLKAWPGARATFRAKNYAEAIPLYKELEPVPIWRDESLLSQAESYRATDKLDDAITTLDPLPPGWNQLPYSQQVRDVGDAWVRARKGLALRVPSAVARGHSNVLLNPGHPRFVEVRRLSDEALALDDRLFAG